MPQSLMPQFGFKYVTKIQENVNKVSNQINFHLTAKSCNTFCYVVVC